MNLLEAFLAGLETAVRSPRLRSRTRRKQLLAIARRLLARNLPERQASRLRSLVKELEAPNEPSGRRTQFRLVHAVNGYVPWKVRIGGSSFVTYVSGQRPTLGRYP
jgi:hypothetical protein